MSLVYWLAVFAPAGTPQPIQKTLADAIAEALKDPATAKAMTQGRMEISPLPLDQFAAYVKERDGMVDEGDQGRGHRTRIRAGVKQ